jgi:DNA ligase 4
MKRSGRFIKIARNLLIDLNEYFIIIFYDILLLNDIICIGEFYYRRRRLLEFLIRRIFDRTNIINYQIINFSFPNIL